MPPTPERKSRTIEPRIAQPLQPGRQQRRKMSRAISATAVRARDASYRLQTDPEAPAFDRDTETNPCSAAPWNWPGRSQ